MIILSESEESDSECNSVYESSDSESEKDEQNVFEAKLKRQLMNWKIIHHQNMIQSHHLNQLIEMTIFQLLKKNI